MDLSNMFSDLAPISNSGYREQLYTDPGILQGQEFLKNEKMVKTEVERTLDLNLISDSHGTESTIISSAEDFDSNGFKEGMEVTQETRYNNLRDQYNALLTSYNNVILDFQKKYEGGVAPSYTSDDAKLQRKKNFDKLKSLSENLNMIAKELISSVKDNTTTDFNSYNKMQNKIDMVQSRIVEIYDEMQRNKLKNPYDIITSLAKEEETALLTKQRYYVYIIWLVILVVVLYVTITNLISADSSLTVLIVSLVLLACLFIYFTYSQWNAEWYDFKYKLKNLSLPDIPKIDFNPLVRIKYTS